MVVCTAGGMIATLTLHRVTAFIEGSCASRRRVTRTIHLPSSVLAPDLLWNPQGSRSGGYGEHVARAGFRVTCKICASGGCHPFAHIRGLGTDERHIHDMPAYRALLFRRSSAPELRNQREIRGPYACDNLIPCLAVWDEGYVLCLIPCGDTSCLTIRSYHW